MNRQPFIITLNYGVRTERLDENAVTSSIQHEIETDFKLDNFLLHKVAQFCPDFNSFKLILALYGEHQARAVSARSKNNWNVVHLVARYGDIAMFRLALDRLGESAPDALAATTKEGWNVVHLVARYGDIAMFKLALDVLGESAPDAIAATIKEGWNVPHLVARYGDITMLDLTLKALCTETASLLAVKTEYGVDILNFAALRAVELNNERALIKLVKLIGLKKARELRRDFLKEFSEKTKTASIKLDQVLTRLEIVYNIASALPLNSAGMGYAKVYKDAVFQGLHDNTFFMAGDRVMERCFNMNAKVFDSFSEEQRAILEKQKEENHNKKDEWLQRRPLNLSAP